MTPTFGGYIALGDLDASYQPQAFVSLVAKIFDFEVPKRFGAAWRSLERPWILPPTRKAHVLDRAKAASADLLGEYLKGGLGPEALQPIVVAAGNLDWQDFRPDLEKARALLPPPGERERAQLKLQAEVREFRLTLGLRGTSFVDYLNREGTRRASSEPALLLTPLPGPVPNPLGKPEPVAPLSAEEESRFGKLDEAYRALDDLERTPRLISGSRCTSETNHPSLASTGHS